MIRVLHLTRTFKVHSNRRRVEVKVIDLGHGWGVGLFGISPT